MLWLEMMACARYMEKELNECDEETNNLADRYCGCLRHPLSVAGDVNSRSTALKKWIRQFFELCE